MSYITIKNFLEMSLASQLVFLSGLERSDLEDLERRFDRHEEAVRQAKRQEYKEEAKRRKDEARIFLAEMEEK